MPVLTDGLAPEDAAGIWISLFTPEATEGGVIGLLRDGDPLRIDLTEGRIRTGIGASELENREPTRFPEPCRYERTPPATPGPRFPRWKGLASISLFVVAGFLALTCRKQATICASCKLGRSLTASSLGYGSPKRSRTNPASTRLFSHELKVRMKTGIRKGCSPSRTSGGAAEKSHSWTSPSRPEVVADLDGVRVSGFIAKVPAVWRVEAGMGDGELEETARPEHPKDLGQHTLRLGYVHQAHKRRHEVEARRFER